MVGLMISSRMTRKIRKNTEFGMEGRTYQHNRFLTSRNELSRSKWESTFARASCAADARVRESAARQAGSAEFVHAIILCFGTIEEPRGDELKKVM